MTKLDLAAREVIVRAAGAMLAAGLSEIEGGGRERVVGLYAAATLIARDLREVIRGNGDGDVLVHLDALLAEAPGVLGEWT